MLGSGGGAGGSGSMWRLLPAEWTALEAPARRTNLINMATEGAAGDGVRFRPSQVIE